MGDERDPLAELGVLREEGVERGEPAQHVLGEVGAVDPQDQVVAPAAQELSSYASTSSEAATRSKRSESMPSG